MGITISPGRAVWSSVGLSSHDFASNYLWSSHQCGETFKSNHPTWHHSLQPDNRDHTFYTSFHGCGILVECSTLIKLIDPVSPCAAAQWLRRHTWSSRELKYCKWRHAKFSRKHAAIQKLRGSISLGQFDAWVQKWERQSIRTSSLRILSANYSNSERSTNLHTYNSCAEAGQILSALRPLIILVWYLVDPDDAYIYIPGLWDTSWKRFISSNQLWTSSRHLCAWKPRREQEKCDQKHREICSLPHASDWWSSRWHAFTLLLQEQVTIWNS